MRKRENREEKKKRHVFLLLYVPSLQTLTLFRMCELQQDLEIFPSGDLTEIGEKGKEKQTVIKLSERTSMEI